MLSQYLPPLPKDRTFSVDSCVGFFQIQSAQKIKTAFFFFLFFHKKWEFILFPSVESETPYPLKELKIQQQISLCLETESRLEESSLKGELRNAEGRYLAQRLRLHLGCLHPISEYLGSSLGSTAEPSFVMVHPGKQQVMTQMAQIPTGKICLSCRLLALASPSPGYCGHLVVNHRTDLSLSLSLVQSLPV